MGTEKLETSLETVEIKQTRDKVEPIRFRDETINKIKKEHYNFNNKSFLFIPFKVSNDSHQNKKIQEQIINQVSLNIQMKQLKI